MPLSFKAGMNTLVTPINPASDMHNNRPNRNVALFVTCLTDQFYPQVGVAIVKILEHFGCTVHFPKDQTCCGQPLYNNGYHDQAAALAKRMIALFEPYDYIITPSASCCAMVRNHYPDLLAADPAWKTGCHKLASSTYEFIEFLDKVLRVDLSRLSLPTRQTVTYHQTCHLRSIDYAAQSLRFLQQMGNIDLRPMDRSEQCCGFGGTFSVNYPPISSSIVQDKVDSIAATNAPVTVCNEAGCSLHIAGAAHRQGVDTQLKHMAELIAETLHLDLKAW
jgi:L-lactate dehydrogenase complex protein LldE